MMSRFVSEAGAMMSEQPEVMHQPAIRALNSLMQALGPKLNPTDMQAIGFGSAPDFVLYGLDLMPVLRVRIANGERLRGFFTDAMKDAGLNPRWTARGDWSIWRTEEELSAVLAIRANELVISIALTDELEATIPRLIGETQPSAPFGAAAGDAFLKRRGYQAWNFGWFDLGAAMRADRLTRLTQGVPACHDELRQMADGLRLEFGSGAPTSDGFTGSMHVPLSPAALETARRVLRPARGPKALKRVDGLFLSMGFDTPTVLDSLASWGAKRKQAPYRCEALLGLNQIAEGLSVMPVPYQLQKIEGLSWAMPGGMVAGLMPEVAMAVHAQSSKPLIGLLATWLPFLGQLAENTPHQIPVPMPAPVHWLHTTSTIGTAVGTAGLARLSSLTQMKIETDAFMIAHADMQFIEAMRDLQDEVLPPEQRRSEVDRRIDKATATDDLNFVFGRVGAEGLDFDFVVRYLKSSPKPKPAGQKDAGATAR